MSKLEKGQNVTKSAEESAVELDGKMSMDAKLIGKLITQQVAATMVEKTKQYENKNRKLEKGGTYWVSGESKKKTVRGAVGAPPIKRKNQRLRRLQIQKHPINLRLNRHKADRSSFGVPWGDKSKKKEIPTAVLQETEEGRKQHAWKAHRGRPSRPWKPTAPNQTVGQRKC